MLDNPSDRVFVCSLCVLHARCLRWLGLCGLSSCSLCVALRPLPSAAVGPGEGRTQRCVCARQWLLLGPTVPPCTVAHRCSVLCVLFAPHRAASRVPPRPCRVFPVVSGLCCAFGRRRWRPDPSATEQLHSAHSSRGSSRDSSRRHSTAADTELVMAHTLVTQVEEPVDDHDSTAIPLGALVTQARPDDGAGGNGTPGRAQPAGCWRTFMSFFCISNKQAQAQPQQQPLASVPPDQKQLVPSSSSSSQSPTPTTPVPRPPHSSSFQKYLLDPLPDPSPSASRARKCLVLDLDETLVHSSFKPIPNPDFIISIELEGVIHKVSTQEGKGSRQQGHTEANATGGASMVRGTSWAQNAHLRWMAAARLASGAMDHAAEKDAVAPQRARRSSFRLSGRPFLVFSCLLSLSVLCSALWSLVCCFVSALCVCPCV